MKRKLKIKKYKDGTKFYYNEKDEHHRLTGPAVEWHDGDKGYFINDIYYMYFSKNYNKLIIYTQILNFIPKYEKYIKQNIKDLIQEYNPEIELCSDFYTQKRKLNKNYLKRLPNWLKDLIIL